MTNIRFLKKLLNHEHGNISILFAFSIVLLLGAVGLVVDVGSVFKEKSDLKKMASTAALSGAQELTNGDPNRVKNVVNTILSSYQAAPNLDDLQINLNQQVRVTLRKSVPMVFIKLFGIQEMSVKQSATANLNALSGLANGATPLGVPDTLELTYGQPVKLKLGAGDSTTGNFGILALEGKGASTYEETLKYGSKIPFSVGDIVGIETGNIEGPTERAVNYRIAQCPNPSADTTVRNCARILPVIVYHTLNDRQIKVVGFAYFYLQPMSDKGEIVGTFIKRVVTGTYGGIGTVDRGVYMTRLTE